MRHREAVARTLNELADAIEANDLPRVLSYVAPNALDVRSDAETLMPLVHVNKANVLGTPDIAVDQQQPPPTATVRCKGFVNVVVRQNGMHGGYMDHVTIEFVVAGDRCLITSYQPERDWHRAAGRGH